jgi:hypothetical protein
MRDASKLQVATLSLAALVALLAATGGSAADSVAEGTFERTLAVSGEVDLDLSTGSGSVTIRPGDGATVRVIGKVRSHRRSREDAEDDVRRIMASPPIEQSGGTIRIGRMNMGEAREGGISISYDVVVPPTTRVRSKTGSGSQSIEGVRGAVECSSGSGSLKLRAIGGDAKANTGSGGIEIEDVGGVASASTGSGSITARSIGKDFSGNAGSGSVRLDGASGTVEVGTGSGDVTVDAVRGSLRAHTGSGNIRAAGDPAREWKLDAGSGSITVRLPAQAGFELDARSDSGNIDVAHPLTVRGKMSQREIAGTVRGGGFQLRVHSGSGKIRIE